jgi:hypothetical protein
MKQGMSVEQFTDGLEPQDPDAVIWRFMELWKFQDLMTSRELYFCRADLLGDDNEGLPPENIVPDLNLNPLDVRDALTIDHYIGVLAQRRRSSFVNCWYLSTEPTAAMWQDYGSDGLAISSRYSLLKAGLESGKDRGFLGLVHYGASHLKGRSWNVLRFISTKREQFAHEKEVRALLWFPDECGGDTWHFDENNIPHRRPLTEAPATLPKFKRLRVDLCSLITEIQLSPWASGTTFAEVNRMAAEMNLAVPIRWSDLAQHKALIATQKDLLELLRARSTK